MNILLLILIVDVFKSSLYSEVLLMILLQSSENSLHADDGIQVDSLDLLLITELTL